MSREGVRISNFSQNLEKTEIGELLKFYALKTNKRIHMINCTPTGTGTSTELSFSGIGNFSTDTIRIEVNNLPEVERRTSSGKLGIVKVYGKEINFARIAFVQGPANKDVRFVKDENEKHLAWILYNIIYIPFDFMPNLKSGFLILRYILEKAVDLLCFDSSKWAELQQKESLKAYIRLLKSGFQREVRLSRQRAEALQNEIREFTRRLQVSHRKALEETQLLETLQTRDTSAYETKAKEDFEKMRKLIENGIYENIGFQDGACLARTGKCYVTFQKRRYFIGRFEIKIGKDSTEYINLDYKNSSYQHPHIAHGNPCYGNIGEELAKLTGRKEYLIALQLIYRYLNSYNHNDAHAKIGTPNFKWKEVDKDGKFIKRRR